MKKYEDKILVRNKQTKPKIAAVVAFFAAVFALVSISGFKHVYALLSVLPNNNIIQTGINGDDFVFSADGHNISPNTVGIKGKFSNYPCSSPSISNALDIHNKAHSWTFAENGAGSGYLNSYCTGLTGDDNNYAIFNDGMICANNTVPTIVRTSTNAFTIDCGSQNILGRQTGSGTGASAYRFIKCCPLFGTLNVSVNAPQDGLVKVCIGTDSQVSTDDEACRDGSCCKQVTVVNGSGSVSINKSLIKGNYSVAATHIFQ